MDALAEPGKRTRSVLIEFGAGQDGNEFLSSGWGAPEDGFVWSEGPFSEILLPSDSQHTRVTVSAWGYVPAGFDKQQILTFANGILVGMHELQGKEVLEFDLPDRLIGQKVKLSFHVPTAKSPRAAEGVPDDRRLGIAVAGMTLR